MIAPLAQNPKQGSALGVGVYSFKRWRSIFQLKKPLLMLSQFLN